MYKCTPHDFTSYLSPRQAKNRKVGLAIYHLRLKVHSRGLGKGAPPGAVRRSALAAAAYRSGERLFDLYQGKWFEYDKPDVVFKEILAPEGPSTPAWIYDRQALWNQVERAEKRGDAQLAREVEITLPRELTRDQQIALVRGFLSEHFVALGMVADYAIHAPDAADGLEQPHCHCLLTTRRIDSDSPSGFGKKERDWNEREDVARLFAEARKAFNDDPSPETKGALEHAEALRQVNIWRSAWSAHANRALEAAGREERIDHRTLEAQGIMRAAQPHLGLARHIEKAYDFLKTRITNWVAIKKRAELYADLEHYKRRDPVKVADFVLRLGEIAEDFAASFRKPKDIPEVPIDR